MTIAPIADAGIAAFKLVDHRSATISPEFISALPGLAIDAGVAMRQILGEVDGNAKGPTKLIDFLSRQGQMYRPVVHRGVFSDCSMRAWTKASFKFV